MNKHKGLAPDQIRIVVVLCILLFSYGCAMSNSQRAGGDPKMAIADIAALQHRAQTAATSFKRNHPATDATYVSGRSKYRDAAAKNKGYLAAVQTGLINREKNFDTPSYRTIAKDAGEAAKEFVDLAEQNTPADGRAMGIASVALGSAEVLIQAGIDIWRAYNEMESDKARTIADSLKQYEWPAWEDL